MLSYSIIMKHRIFYFLLACSTTIVYAQQTSVLFLGNSYTYVNNLPQTLKDLALSLGDSIIFDSNTPGGYTFQGHSTNTTSIQKINQQAWDYVVLQEQSQLPSFSTGQVSAAVYPYARMLDSMILANDSCTETLFYMTWGRQNGDASNCAAYPPICTYDGMQQRLRESYMEMALNNHASVSPVGVAWKQVRDNYPSINLYQTDQSHPSIHGTYLAACVFYSSIFHRSSVGGIVSSGISTSDGLILQSLASHTVLDSLSLWQSNGDIPLAQFSYSQNNNQITCFNQSDNSSSYNWDFGDGTFSTSPNPQHTYSTNGSFIVSLTAENACKSTTAIDTIHIQTTGITAFSLNEIKTYPNPASNVINIDLGKNYPNVNISIYSTNGQLIETKEYRSVEMIELNLKELSSGLYFLKIGTERNVHLEKILIEK